MNSLFFTLVSGSIITDNIYYIICVVLTLTILFGIYLMSKVETAVLGNTISGISLGIGIVVTLIKYDALPFWIIYLGLSIGFIIGMILAIRVKMIDMPQMVALLNGVGGAASFLVGIFAYYEIGAGADVFSKSTSLLAISVGIITFVGSLIAAGKLHKILTQKSVVFSFHQTISVLALLLAVIAIVLGSIPNLLNPLVAVLATTIFSTLFAIMFTVQVGGADMPITISLLNSFSGVAGAIAGLAISDILLVAVGGIVGSSGLLLTQIMCRAMNRSLFDILLGRTTVSTKSEKKEHKSHEPDTSYLKVLKEAKKVLIVPGYGMALAQAQYLVKNLADKLIENGASVKYAIHPLAGRIIGHMNVLLVEAKIDYDDFYELEESNQAIKNADLTIVIGANDIINPETMYVEAGDLHGMPVLHVEESKELIIFNYDTKAGYIGIDNPIYDKEGVHLVLGDASKTLSQTIEKLNEEFNKSTKEIETGYLEVLKAAKNVLIVPGYGMALAQAQHLVKKLADKLRANGAIVKFAIHPVAGRMPGHMNVLLAEADVDYEDLYEMAEINAEFKNADLTIVVGANDVLNPAARSAKGTPIYGMPILNVDQSQNIIIFNYDTKAGYAGVDNPLYLETRVQLVLGDAYETIGATLKNLDSSSSKDMDNQELNTLDLIKAAKNVLIVPGYGMALAQAQHLVKKLADKLRANGANVKFAIHPVAGRMPGHMNVLLAEADVDYEDLYEMAEINAEFKNADLTIVVGANDVLNPAARSAKGTPIYGMPILNVDQSQNIIIFNYDTKAGYAGVDNPLYLETRVQLVLGDAYKTLNNILDKL